MSIRQAHEWLAQDPDPETRAQLQAILEQGDEAALAQLFGATLRFGTAGLRGELGPGPNRMNRVVVMRAAAGLAKVIGADGHVVVGYDARYKSDVFARDTAAVLTGAGLRVSLMAEHWPTPVLAFAVRRLGCDAGVMVTASHNPPRDNGYKVYWRDGAQIVPPIDSRISAAIRSVDRVDQLPLGDDWATLDDAAIVEPYLDAVTALPIGPDRDLRVAYTPLHGVGGSVLIRAFDKAGFAAPTVVKAQFEPDPAFPTVGFPNPEEPGATDLVLKLAAETGADLVIANDPDADRCAVGVPLPDGSWRLLTGDEVGGLLAEHVLAHTSGDDRLLATTIVSSSLLGRIAAAHGVRHETTLTGFKWIVRAGGPGARLVYGYEEALGYALGSDAGLPVRDKDGIGTALAVAGMAATAKRAGRTLLDLLDDQAVRYGLHATTQLALRVADVSLIERVMDRLRAAPPSELAGHDVLSIDDLATGQDGLPPTDGLRYYLSGDARIVIRPSGTEPKLKCYLELITSVTTTPAAARAEAAHGLGALKEDLSLLLVD
ncbi:MAG TPA: phospho-sugar mutase [Thermopolyspora sp.]